MISDQNRRNNKSKAISYDNLRTDEQNDIIRNRKKGLSSRFDYKTKEELENPNLLYKVWFFFLNKLNGLLILKINIGTEIEIRLKQKRFI